MSGSSNQSTNQSGFTLIELMVAVSIMAIIGVVFLGLVANYFVVITRNNELAEMTINSQNLLRTTVENIRLGDGVRQTNQITDAHAPAGGWSTSNSTFVIIIAVPAVTQTHDYIIDTDTGSPFMNELVYYKSGTDLMERKLANPDATGNSLRTTCPENFASTSCPADTKLAAYVSSMTFTLYDQDGGITTDPTQGRSILISLRMQRNAPGQPLNLDTSTQVTLRNRF
ncbi:MAG TPA: prepilin-type N-terminal cleavage/methylation domain-containing protein [Candidatus Saccharimonadales bacterium]|nr:prepilin-type N-terminal cleavage/methylation domain-containing protein [Candidatus Saccharimonadales bacterium]